MKEIDKEKLIDEVFKSINELEENYDYEIVLRNAYDTLGIAKLDISIEELDLLLKRSGYRLNEDKKYIKD